MPTFNITPTRISIIADSGDDFVIPSDSSSYDDAVNACLSADWQELETILFTPEEAGIDEYDDIEEDVGTHIHSTADVIDVARGLIEDGIITARDLGIDEHEGHEHDLSQWDGSPIFYPTEEMAMAQHNRWGMFWDFHDFGPAAPNGYRYATVPRGIGPYAPEGYDWVCLKREDRYKV